MWLDALIAILCISTFLAVFEWATIHYKIPVKHSRKVVHLVTSLLVVGVALAFGWKLFVFLGLLFTVFLALARITRPFKSIEDKSSQSIGEVIFPLGVAIAASISQDIGSFIAVVLILGISDTLAYYIGSVVKSKRLLFQKTLAGTASFFVSALCISVFFFPLPIALALACATTLAELVSNKGFDNLTIPIVGALIVVLL